MTWPIRLLSIFRSGDRCSKYLQITASMEIASWTALLQKGIHDVRPGI
jgi:hypothetical protein